MPSSAHKSAVQGVELTIEILEGRGLVAKDSSGVFSKTKTSDPFVKIIYNDHTCGKTKTVEKSLSPRWNQTFTVNLSLKDAQKVMNGSAKHSEIHFVIFDEDTMSDDDPMGTVSLPVRVSDTPPDVAPAWHRVGVGSGEYKCKKASGELLLKITSRVKQLATLSRGNVYPVEPATVLRVGVGWDIEGKSKFDLDTSCVAIDFSGNILMNETVYYGDYSNSNGSIVHSGDEDTGYGDVGGSLDDEVITCDLDRVPPHVCAMYFILTVATPDMSFANIKSASVRIVNQRTGCGMCQIIPSDAGQCPALFLLRVARDVQNVRNWCMYVMDATHPTARDFGALVPEIKGYSRDILPNIIVNPNERIAILRKGGNIQLMDYFAGGTGQLPDPLMFGLSWDITKGREIDLDASVICLDASLVCQDIVYFQQLVSRDGAVRHGGDEREGDEVGFDEKIYLHLNRVHPVVQFIGLVINSYSGQELDDVAKASCSLVDPNTNAILAKYGLSKSKALDKHTALLMACLHRDQTNPTMWQMRIIGEAAHGRVAKDLVDEMQAFLSRNPPLPPYIPPPPPASITCQMPPVVPYPPTQQMQNMSMGSAGGPPAYPPVSTPYPPQGGAPGYGAYPPPS